MRALMPMLVTMVCCGVAAASAQDEAKRWEAFSLEDLREQREASARPWLSFLEMPSLTTGLYALPKEGEDRQSPHERDEVYYVISGRAILEVDGGRTAVQEGSVVFVKAQVEHRFVEIQEPLEVLVFFAALATGE